jgi:hypothetical protein
MGMRVGDLELHDVFIARAGFIDGGIYRLGPRSLKNGHRYELISRRGDYVDVREVATNIIKTCAAHTRVGGVLQPEKCE